MGNNIGGGYNKAAKVMKINGEYFKLKTPSKVIDIIKDYPDHILLDSEEFLRFNLRAKPLDLDFELKPKKIYLLFELPKFPQNKDIIINSSSKSPLRRVRSGVQESTLRKMMMTKRSVSDLSIVAKSTAGDDGSGGGGGGDHVVGPTRVKVRLPKGQVKRIMEESNDDAEVAHRILRLSTTADGGDVVVEGCGGGGGRGEESENVVVVKEDNEEEEMEVEVVDRHCINVYGIRGSHQRKYMKLSS